ncbi:hypothetical protein [Photobacterium sp. 53610]|uniref:hypothetical protein n=1 Tax=Photobacterium sp. 53610 TaxID=3102789 RepID=UPI002EDA3BC8
MFAFVRASPFIVSGGANRNVSPGQCPEAGGDAGQNKATASNVCQNRCRCLDNIFAAFVHFVLVFCGENADSVARISFSLLPAFNGQV